MTGGELLIECLIAQGVDTVFGMPGIQTDYIYAPLIKAQDRIRHILFRNEQSGALMAEGYARASGRPAVCLTVPGPGATNASTGVAEALSACTPMLLITGGTKTAHEHKNPARLFHGLDQQSLFDPITKWHCRVGTADEIPGAVERAFREMLCGRPGPVHLELPPDALKGGTSAAPCPRIHREDDQEASEGITELARAFESAHSPVVIAGSGVVFSSSEGLLRRLAEDSRTPVVTSLPAKGALPEDHPLSLGCIRSGPARKAIEASDCVLAVGCRFTYFDTSEWGMKIPEPLYCLATDEQDVPEEFAVTRTFYGDIASLLNALLSETRMDLQPRDEWLAQVASARGEPPAKAPHPLLPALRSALPRDAIVVADVHMTGYQMQSHFPVYSSRSFLYSGVYVALGYGLPAAIGAKVAFPDREVVAFCGDGGFALTIAELATVVQLGLDLKVIVVNDGGYTSVRFGQEKLSGGNTLGADLKHPDFMKLADAHGIPGTRIESLGALDAALREGLSRPGPALIEVVAEGELATR